MNFSTSVFIINSACRMVVCEYDPDNTKDRRVNYKTLDPTIQKGDMVVVPTDTRHRFTAVKVIDVDIPVDFDQSGDVKWIVQKVDTDHFAKLIEDEAHAIKTLQGLEQKRRADEMRKLLIGGDDPEAVKGLTLYKNGESVPAAGGGSAAPGNSTTITIDAERL